jgi:hypothetical protein
MLNILNAVDSFFIPGCDEFYSRTRPDLWQRVWDDVEFKVKTQNRLTLDDESEAIKRFRELTEMYKKSPVGKPTIAGSLLAPHTTTYATAIESGGERCANINCENHGARLKPRTNADGVSLLLCDSCVRDPRFRMRESKR